eukprot:scaffold13821_cov30-Tisochrysis_lutea.AAC.1
MEGRIVAMSAMSRPGSPRRAAHRSCPKRIEELRTSRVQRERYRLRASAISWLWRASCQRRLPCSHAAQTLSPMPCAARRYLIDATARIAIQRHARPRRQQASLPGGATRGIGQEPGLFGARGGLQ